MTIKLFFIERFLKKKKSFVNDLTKENGKLKMLIWAYSLIINKINRSLYSIYWKLFVISSNNQIMYKLLFILFIIKLKIWKQITRGFKNDENLYLKRILLVRIIPKYWTKTLIENTTNS